MVNTIGGNSIELMNSKSINQEALSIWFLVLEYCPGMAGPKNAYLQWQ